MGILQVSLFGRVRVLHSSLQCEIKLTPIIQQLLAYLLLERHRLHSREILASLFWGDQSQERARNCLNTAVWRLRKALEQGDSSHRTYLVTTQSGEIGFNARSELWLDIAVFEQTVNQMLGKPVDHLQAEEAKELESVLQLYSGELLEGIYEDWALRAREYARALYLNGLSALMSYYKSHHLAVNSLEFGQKILAVDPLREEIHRELMRLYVDSGQRALAVRQYAICQHILQTELGIQPMEETQALYREISAEKGEISLSFILKEPEDLRQAVIQLRQANHNLELAQTQYRQALQYLETFTREG